MIRAFVMLTFLQHAPFAPALGGLAGFLSRGMGGSSEVGEDLASRLSTEQSRVISELEHHRAEATRLKQELESVWDNEHEAGYELTAVFIHRGSSPSFGHYFLYARNLPAKPDQWFKYNDSSVTVVSKDEVLADTTGSTANPYMVSRIDHQQPSPVLTTSYSSFSPVRAQTSSIPFAGSTPRHYLQRRIHAPIFVGSSIQPGYT